MRRRRQRRRSERAAIRRRELGPRARLNAAAAGRRGLAVASEGGDSGRAAGPGRDLDGAGHQEGRGPGGASPGVSQVRKLRLSLALTARFHQHGA